MPTRLEQLQKLHHASPGDPFLTYGIALELAKSDDLTGSLKWLDKTIALDANYCYAYFQKGKLLAGDGRETEARQVLQAGMAAATRAGDSHAHSEIAGLLESL